MPSDLTPLGDVLVRFSASIESSDQMTIQLREVHEEFIRSGDAEVSYLQMGFLAAKAIERCRQLEGSDADDRVGRSDRPGARDDVRPDRAPSSHGPAPRSPAT